MKKLGIYSRGIMRIPHLKAFLPEFEDIVFRPSEPSTCDAIAGWGMKDTAQRARSAAEKFSLPYLALEDGFLRSLDLGVNGASPMSVILDDMGIYYDCARPSRLETLLNRDETLAAMHADAALLIAEMRRLKIGKYNCAPDISSTELELGHRPLVIVLDQTFGDKSVELGNADATTFTDMVEAAIAENPDADLRIKTHPDVWSGKKRGYLGAWQSDPRVRFIALDVNWMSLAPHASRVYTVSSHAGMEALICGVPVTCFGIPYYSGWGLTDDRRRCDRRRRNRTVEELVAAAYLIYPRYLDPITGRSCTAIDVLHRLAMQRRWNERNRGYKAVVGVFRWKRPHMTPYLHSTGGRVRYIRSAARAVAAARHRNGRVLVWGGFEPPDLRAAAEQAGVPLIRIEDGFIRSTGLGSDLVRASSLVFDDAGIYFDPRSPSRLEQILATAQFSHEELTRAAALRQRINDARITKYNYGARAESSLAATLAAEGRERILVPGQVEDDKSIVLGAPGVHTNLDLLRAVREESPHAFIVYKPHPDVESGNRKGIVDPDALARYADRVVRGVSATAVLDYVDTVHTMTSLLGFEALLRGKRVTTWGMPFYAGWGLTEDRLPPPRRQRRIALDELVAAVLLRYPVYFDWDSGCPCEPEDLLEKLKGGPVASQAGWWRRKLRTVRGWLGR